ncbi:MAG: hypothetical protein D6732_23255, partial [Methanobacteriota archaeon]
AINETTAYAWFIIEGVKAATLDIHTAKTLEQSNVAYYKAGMGLGTGGKLLATLITGHVLKRAQGAWKRWYIRRGLTKRVRGTRWYKKIARWSTRRPSSKKVVLGKLYEDGYSYIDVANELEATYFHIENWDEISNTLSRDEIWEINEAFLRQQLAEGKEIILAHNPTSDRLQGFFKRELEFLKVCWAINLNKAKNIGGLLKNE